MLGVEGSASVHVSLFVLFVLFVVVVVMFMLMLMMAMLMLMMAVKQHVARGISEHQIVGA